MGDEPQIQSNTANFLNDIGVKNAKNAQGLGDLIGAVADVAGAIVGAKGLVDFLISQFTTQPDPLQPVLDAIRTAFHQLAADLKAENIITRRKDNVKALGPARTVVVQLNDFIKEHPTDVERLNKIDPCITAIHDLGSEAYWLAPFNDQIFWTDAGLRMWPSTIDIPIGGSTSIPTDRGYGERAPTPNAVEGNVFNYFYILPAYLEAVSIYLAAFASLLPDFIHRFPDHVQVLRDAVGILQTRHDTIVSAITPISPGHWDRQKLLIALQNMNSTFPFFTAGVLPLAPSGFERTPQELGGVSIEYGAVEKFSGVSSMGDYKISYAMIDAMPASDATEFNKFQIHLEKKAKDVYVKVGLLDVWKTINCLKTLVGDALLSRPNFADWSFRDLISTAQIPPRQDGFFHLSDLAGFLSQQHTGVTGFRRWLY